LLGVLYHYTFLDHAFSFVAERNSLVTAAASKGAATAYPRDSSSRREGDHL